MTGKMLGNIFALVKRHRSSNSIKLFLQGSTKRDPADAQSHEIIYSEFQYMKNVVYRVVNIVNFLATQGLAFRGKEEKICSQTNDNF